MKKIILGLVAGMLIGSATTALAAPDTVQAVIGKFKIVVNGQEQQLDNAPLVVKGTTYLPVREVAGLLSHDVGFKDGTITLDAKDVSDLETTVTVTDEWIILADLLQMEGVSSEPGRSDEHVKIKNTLTGAEIEISLIGSGESVMVTQSESLRLNRTDEGVYLYLDDLKSIGIVN